MKSLKRSRNVTLFATGVALFLAAGTAQAHRRPKCEPISTPAVFAGHDWNEVTGYDGWIVGFPNSFDVPAEACWTPHQAWIVENTYSSEIRAELKARGYKFYAPVPILDFLLKLQSMSYVIDAGTPGEQTIRIGNPLSILIVRRFDQLRDDAFEGEEDNPIALFYSTLNPLPPGPHTVDVHFQMRDEHCDGYGVVPEENCIPKGDSAGRHHELTVLPE